MITLSRALLLSLGALFSAYHVFLGLHALQLARSPLPALVAMALYGAATIASLWPTAPVRMPSWLAAFNLGVALALPVLVTSQLDPSIDNGYATWHVAAVGALMTITMVRRRRIVAWVGVVALAAQTAWWGGPLALIGLGAIGSIVWVGVAEIMSRTIVRAARDAAQFARAERETAQWQAAQEAHFTERQLRLSTTYRMASPMLTEIVRSGGRLTEDERRECRYLEGAIRDEIRGRRLLNDAVREEVMAARRRGTVVTLLDEGGIDDLDDEALTEVLDLLALTIHGTTSDKLVVRTVPRSSVTAVTVVGVSSVDDGSATALGAESDDEVDLWLEIPRPGGAVLEPDDANN